MIQNWSLHVLSAASPVLSAASHDLSTASHDLSSASHGLSTASHGLSTASLVLSAESFHPRMCAVLAEVPLFSGRCSRHQCDSQYNYSVLYQLKIKTNL